MDFCSKTALLCGYQIFLQLFWTLSSKTRQIKTTRAESDTASWQCVRSKGILLRTCTQFILNLALRFDSAMFGGDEKDYRAEGIVRHR